MFRSESCLAWGARSQVLQDGALHMARKAGKRRCDDGHNLETCGPQIDCFSNAWER